MTEIKSSNVHYCLSCLLNNNVLLISVQQTCHTQRSYSVKIRWWVAYTLLKNPSLIVSRKSNLRENPFGLVEHSAYKRLRQQLEKRENELRDKLYGRKNKYVQTDVKEENCFIDTEL